MSQYPKLEGRFPQVAGIRFAFDPSKPPGERVEPSLVTVQDLKLELEKVILRVVKLFTIGKQTISY